MTERKEATDPPNTLLGLGPPEPPEPSIVVNLAKTDTKDASVVTVRAWSTSSTDYDDDVNALSFVSRPMRRGAVLAALGAAVFAAAFALTWTFRRPTVPNGARRAPAPPAVASRPPKTTVLVGGPWVLRVGEATEDAASEAPDVQSASELPEYLSRSAPSSEARLRRASVTAWTPRARVISDTAEGAPASDPDRIRAVADAVELDDDEGAEESPSAEPR